MTSSGEPGDKGSGARPEEGGLGAAAWRQKVLSWRREPWGLVWMPPPVMQS